MHFLISCGGSFIPFFYAPYCNIRKNALGVILWGDHFFLSRNEQFAPENWWCEYFFPFGSKLAVSFRVTGVRSGHQPQSWRESCSRHWLGGRNGLEQNRAASAIPKARHSPQRHPWARIRNRQTPARFGPNGLPLGWQSRCRLAP